VSVSPIHSRPWTGPHPPGVAASDALNIPTPMCVDPSTLAGGSKCMLTQETLEKLGSMRLGTIAEAFLALSQDPNCRDLSFEERFGLVVDREWTTRRDRRLASLLKEAHLRLSAPGRHRLRCSAGFEPGEWRLASGRS